MVSKRYPEQSSGMDAKNKFGLRLKMIRKAQGLTQEDLAASIDRSVEAVSNLERGKSLPNFETIERLAASLNVPLKDLFDFEDDTDEERSRLLTELIQVAQSLQTGDLTIALSLMRDLRDREKA